jgi:hypothetical protein
MHAPGLAQDVPTGAIISSHSPVALLHAATRHSPLAAQALASPTHAPPLQTGPTAHLSVVVQATPFILLVAAQAPVMESQTPTLHSSFCAEQSLVWRTVEQVPAEQVPAGVHPLPPQAPLTTASSQLPVVLLQLGAE